MLSRLRLSVAVDKPGRFRESHDLLRRELELSARRASELLFDRVPQILQQVEAVGDLARLRCALSGTLRVESTPVAAHDLYGRTAGEPGRRRNSRSVLQDIQYLAPLKIDHDRPVGAAFAPAPVVHAHHADGRPRRLLVHAALQRPQEGVLALGCPEARHQTSARPAAGRVGKHTSQVDNTTRPAAVRRHDLRQAIGERLLRTLGIEASPSCHFEHQLHGGPMSR